METLDTSRDGEGRFDKTHWSVILAAGDLQAPNHKRAQEEFCDTYWYPVYVFVRRRGGTAEAAKDLTQAFFLWFLTNNKLAGVTQEGGRFRSFLLTVLRRFLTNEWHRQHTQRRGGDNLILSIDDTTERRYQKDLADDSTPEAMFDREWAKAVLQRVYRRLEDEFASNGRAPLFACLRASLPGAHEPLSSEKAAKTLGKSKEAVAAAVHRLRQRFREMLREEVATPGAAREEIDAELRYLLEVMIRK